MHTHNWPGKSPPCPLCRCRIAFPSLARLRDVVAVGAEARMRKGMGLAGLLALLAVSPGWCGDLWESTRGPLGRRVRFLSRTEAISLALEHMAADRSVDNKVALCQVKWLGLAGTSQPTTSHSCQP